MKNGGDNDDECEVGSSNTPMIFRKTAGKCTSGEMFEIYALSIKKSLNPAQWDHQKESNNTVFAT
ncbi:hypothetical protein C5167_006585 [Papaver somniferum]|uniref:Uncharacterized protein n=1 Tax=Papaver somniferum TaxID=3469 RepID=A0A4Y7JHK8_PAPSO|nr:hypothetical protein C5167_006585 [Papaver somniferum]